MDIKGKIIHLLPLQSGEGKNGTWKKQEVVLEINTDKYPKKLCISVWNEKIDNNILKVGNELNVSFDIESREYNGRWYTDVKAWKIEGLKTQSYNQQEEEIPDIIFSNDDKEDIDLPF